MIRLRLNIFVSGAELSATIRIRQDFDAAALRRLATTVKDACQARRLLALAEVYDGKDRGSPPQGAHLHAAAAMTPQNHPLDSLKTQKKLSSPRVGDREPTCIGNPDRGVVPG